MNAKGEALLHALAQGFDKLESLGANRKAVIFTESRRTQEYLYNLLEANGYSGQVMTFNGTNTDTRSADIYKTWRAQHAGEDIVSGSKTLDIRSALIAHFQENAPIMVATEAAAEGVNLQFCSLVVNYDLPWNPQRIEQRIGRCHRYGQKHDVVVINFLNRSNEADLRVFQILSDKFRLFDGVFGASDEVLGAVESGVDFEKRIADIYQSCRTPTEIDAAFDSLQRELEEQIEVRLASTRAMLLENFDEDVRARLRLNYQEASAQLDKLGRCLWKLTLHELRSSARFDETALRFDLASVPLGCEPVPTGSYQLIAGSGPRDGRHVYRPGHPLAEFLIARAAARQLEPAKLVFDYTDYRRTGRISLVEELVGKSGFLSLTRVSVQALEREDHLLFSGRLDSGEQLDGEVCEKLFNIDGRVSGPAEITTEASRRLEEQMEQSRSALLTQVAERNGLFFEEEIEKLERWAEDLKDGLEQELKELDAQIKALKKQAKFQVELESKLALHREAKELEGERSRKRRALFDAQDEIDRKKESLISEVEARLQQRVDTEPLFTIRWELT